MSYIQLKETNIYTIKYKIQIQIANTRNVRHTTAGTAEIRFCDVTVTGQWSLPSGAQHLLQNKMYLFHAATRRYNI